MGRDSVRPDRDVRHVRRIFADTERQPTERLTGLKSHGVLILASKGEQLKVHGSTAEVGVID
jgi:hypothetical protein